MKPQNFQGLLIMYMYKNDNLTYKKYIELVNEHKKKGKYLKSMNNQWSNILTSLQNNNHPDTKKQYGSFIDFVDKNTIKLKQRWRKAIERLITKPTCSDVDCKKIKHKIESGKLLHTLSDSLVKKSEEKSLTQPEAFLIALYLEDIINESSAKSVVYVADKMIKKYKIHTKGNAKQLANQISIHIFNLSKKGREARDSGITLTEEEKYRTGHKYIKYLKKIKQTSKQDVYYLTEEGQRFVQDTYPEEINTIRQQQKYIDHYTFKEPGHSA